MVSDTWNCLELHEGIMCHRISQQRRLYSTNVKYYSEAKSKLKKGGGDDRVQGLVEVREGSNVRGKVAPLSTERP